MLFSEIWTEFYIIKGIEKSKGKSIRHLQSALFRSPVSGIVLSIFNFNRLSEK